MGEQKQFVLGKSEQRPLQHGRQVQIVFRQQQEPPERDQILHRELLRQHQPVGAGDRHVLLLQRPDQIGDKQIAPPHQHHDVAGPDRAVARFQSLTRRKPAGNRRRNRPRQPGARFGAALAHPGDRIQVEFFIRLGHDRRPQLDESGVTGACRCQTSPNNRFRVQLRGHPIRFGRSSAR